MNDTLWGLKKWWKDRLQEVNTPRKAFNAVTDIMVVAMFIITLLFGISVILNFIFSNLGPAPWIN